MALNLSVSFETWPADLGMPGSLQKESSRKIPPNALFQKDLHVVTDRQFGERVGIFRVLDLFEREGIKSTFFLNGITVKLFPELAKAMRQSGHELASETYIHDYSFMKTYEQDRADIHKSIQAFDEVLGERPLGYLSTGHLPTDDTPRIVSAEGYRYWVDPSHEELPYTLRVDGKELVVMTYTLDVGDYSTVGDQARTFRQVVEMWKDSFDWLYSEGARSPTRMAIVLHPYIAGRPYRMKGIEEFIQYVKRFQGVWFCRLIDVANWWSENYRDTHVEEWPNYSSLPPLD